MAEDPRILSLESPTILSVFIGTDLGFIGLGYIKNSVGGITDFSGSFYKISKKRNIVQDWILFNLLVKKQIDARLNSIQPFENIKHVLKT